MSIDYTSPAELEKMKSHIRKASAFQFNAPVETDVNGDQHYPGPAGEELRDLKAYVKAYNKANRHNPDEPFRYRVGLQGRLGPKSPHAHHYKGLQNRRIKLKHSAYVGVYIWSTLKDGYEWPHRFM